MKSFKLQSVATILFTTLCYIFKKIIADLRDNINIAPSFAEAKTLFYIRISVYEDGIPLSCIVRIFDVETRKTIRDVELYSRARYGNRNEEKNIKELKELAVNYIANLQFVQGGNDDISAWKRYNMSVEAFEDIGHPAYTVINTIEKVPRLEPDRSKLTDFSKTDVKAFVIKDIQKDTLSNINVSKYILDNAFINTGKEDWLVLYEVLYKNHFEYYLYGTGGSIGRAKGYRAYYNIFLLNGRTGEIVTSYAIDKDPPKSYFRHMGGTGVIYREEEFRNRYYLRENELRLFQWAEADELLDYIFR